MPLLNMMLHYLTSKKFIKIFSIISYLIYFLQAKESWSMNDAEKLEQSDVLKKRAGELFKVSRLDTPQEK